MCSNDGQAYKQSTTGATPTGCNCKGCGRRPVQHFANVPFSEVFRRVFHMFSRFSTCPAVFIHSGSVGLHKPGILHSLYTAGGRRPPVGDMLIHTLHHILPLTPRKNKKGNPARETIYITANLYNIYAISRIKIQNGGWRCLSRRSGGWIGGRISASGQKRRPRAGLEW